MLHQSLPCLRVLLLAFIATAAGPGCWRYSSGQAARLTEAPATPPSDAWPARDVDAVRPLLDATPGWMYDACLTDMVEGAPGLQGPAREALDSPRFTVEHSGLHGQGLIRVYSRGEPGDEFSRLLNAAFEQLLTGFTPNASFVSSRTFGDKPVRPFASGDPRLDAENTALRAKGEPYEWQRPDQAAHLTSGLEMRFPPVSVTTHRGLVLHLQSIAGNDYEPRVLDYLRGRGWAIVDIKTATHVSPPIPPGDLPRIEAASRRLAELGRRVQQQARATLAHGGKVRSDNTDPLIRERNATAAELARLRGGSYQADPAGDLTPVAKQIAADVDQTLAGNAYAVEAVLDYVKKQRQDLLGGPVVVMGFSAGALATPAVVARIRDSVDAVVMVGGGADLFSLAQGSQFTDGGVTVRHGDERLPRAAIERLGRLYLEHSRLDAYHTAAALRGLPVLLVDASMDTWVPTRGGDLLYERLGRPDRLRAHLAGHMMLFYFLPSQSERIADWLEANARPDSGR